jgi:hypothetical protein
MWFPLGDNLTSSFTSVVFPPGGSYKGDGFAAIDLK